MAGKFIVVASVTVVAIGAVTVALEAIADPPLIHPPVAVILIVAVVTIVVADPPLIHPPVAVVNTVVFIVVIPLVFPPPVAVTEK